MSYACEGVPWRERSRLAEVCRTFRTLFSACAFSGSVMRLNLNTLSWRIMECKHKAAIRKQLLAAVKRVAPSVTRLSIKFQVDYATKLSLAALLAPLAPYVQVLDVEDGLCLQLIEAMGSRSPAWDSLREVSLSGCNLWIDMEAPEVAQLEQQLAELPALTSKITRFECSCQGMDEGGESFLKQLPALRSLELEDWTALDAPRNYSALRDMCNLSRLTLNIVEDLETNLEDLLSLTQVQELALVGCYRASRGLTRLSNLVMLDLQPMMGVEPGDNAMGPGAAAAWKVPSLTELRWCGDVVFDAGEVPIHLPRLLALEIDEAYFPPSGFHTQLCTALRQLTSLRLVGGICTRLPPDISCLASLQVLAIDSCQLPAMPTAISTLSSVTNLQLSNVAVGPHLPPWVLAMPLRKLWAANNRLTSVLPKRKASAAVCERQKEWMGRLTHVCLSSNQFRELPQQLIEHATQLVELDLAYNQLLQIGSKAVDELQGMTSLRLLRLEKSYWLPVEERWTQASQRAIARLKQARPDLQSSRATDLLGVLSKWDDAYFNQDAEALKALLADNVVQHADQIVTEKDQKGPEAVTAFHRKYFETYQFKHLPIVRAANEQTSSVYSLWDEEAVLMRPEKFDEARPASGSATSLSGIWRLVLDDQLKVADIWFLRTLTREEKKFRLKHRPNQLYTDFKAKDVAAPTLSLSDKQLAKMQAAAEAFNQAWSTGDVAAVHSLMAPSCDTINPIFGERKSSREEWEEMVKDVFQYWEVKTNDVNIAVTASSNKAFLHWVVRGVQKDTQEEQQMYGLNLLCFDDDQQISEVVGFRQPLKSEHDHIFKTDSSYMGHLDKLHMDAEH
ncbi:hypothetical protein D9Q98_003490 [Chlorella vulgaris]|uniref:SnoaL-like domain-containing protein n=1 Tax=Chlorella vulgaris TaxID=3077 RepID=A0A9D4YZ27_CHLVU|nr:hypothetical protein D9Q98_003490 [Chlorella vulgaris]